ncbi:unnamed protein product [Mytilus coruscus]|uniref:Uncharacterized protein n=1 Tax=Mytilus coruscus TaxID=42192 RepID=A0A6J8BHY3_MYTCO|nr:unnamed protein product [Mytilus coruscus]
MSASSDGLTDDIYNEVCDFSYLGGACGISQHYSSTPNTLYKVSECTKDTTVHLRRLNSSENCEFPEGTGLCKRCSIKMKNFIKSDKTQVKLNIEEDIELFERLCGRIASIHEDKEDTDLDMNVNEGWALKLNKPFKRLTKKVKDFLFDIYSKCESSGRRPNFDKLATELKTTRQENDGTKMFTREEWLSLSQIRSLFGNFVKLGAETSVKSEDTADVIENILEEINSLEYHNNMAELATDIVQQFL